MSSSDDLAPVVAADVMLPSICPAVVTSSLVSKALNMCYTEYLIIMNINY